MRPEPTEDEFTFAGRRAREGGKRKEIVAELVARGVSSDLAHSVVNGAMSELPGGNKTPIGWAEVIAGAVLLAAGAGLFIARAADAFGGASVGFLLPSGICVVGGVLLARGLFR